MNSKYELGRISFDLHNLLSSVPPEMKVEMVESLACDDDIIKHVTAQILDGWTQSGYYGSKSCGAHEDPAIGLDWAVRQVSKRSSEVAKKEIERLEAELQRANQRHFELLEENRSLRDSVRRLS